MTPRRGRKERGLCAELRISGTLNSRNTEMQASRSCGIMQLDLNWKKRSSNLVLVRKRQESELDVRREQSDEEEVVGDDEGLVIDTTMEDNAQDETESERMRTGRDRNPGKRY